MIKIAASIWADGPGSNPYQPPKSDIREWGTWLESYIGAIGANGGVVFDDKASIDASLAYDANTMAWVVADDTPANNGIYKKIGASGSGSWVRVADLPYSYVAVVDDGTSSANAMSMDATVPVGFGTIIAVQVPYTNTDTAVTIAFNGGTTMDVKTASMNNPPVGALIQDMVVLGFIDEVNMVFHLLTDISSAAIQAAAEAAAEAAEAAAAIVDPSTWTLKLSDINTITADGTLLATDARALFKLNKSTTLNLTTPSPSAANKVIYDFVNIGTGNAILTTPTGVFTYGAGTTASTFTIIPGESVRVRCDGTNWLVERQSRKIGTAANNVVALDATGKLPAVDGSQLTGLTGAVPIVPYMKWGLLPENISSTVMWFFNGGMSSPGGTATEVYPVQNAAGHTVIDLTTVGAGGRDTGTLASLNNKTLYPYIIVSSTNTGATNSIIMSTQLSAGSVTLPSGFVKAVRIPVAFFYHATFGLRPFHMVGGQPWGVMYTDVETESGTMNLATSNNTAGTGNYADLDASLWVPNNARWLELVTYINSSTGTGHILASTPGVADNRKIGTVSIANTDLVIHWKQRCSSVSVFQLQVPLNMTHTTVVLGYHMSDDC